MRLRLVTITLTFATFLAGGASMAVAGGGRWDFDAAYPSGARVTDTQIVSLRLEDPKLGRLDDAPFYAFLIRSAEDAYHIPLPDEAIRLGEVQLDSDNGRFGTARLNFLVPEVPPGEYQVTVCNEPCRKSLGDMLATPITIVASDLEARLVARIERLEQKIFDLRTGMDSVARSKAEAALNQLRMEVSSAGEVFTARIKDLEARVDKLESHPPAASRTNGALWLGGLIVSIFALLAWGPRRSPFSMETDS
jgi:hypothetical protein